MKIANIVAGLTWLAMSTVVSASTAAAASQVRYRHADVAGVRISYREAGPSNAPVLLLLHGFPSSSRMWQKLIEGLADRYHVVAPDYPGFGNSDAPDPARFAYTFDHIAQIIDTFSEQLGLAHYVLVMQDYGGPVGFRLAIAHPERVTAMVIQNAASHEEALGPLWTSRRAYWRDHDTYLPQITANLLSLEATRQRHVGRSPHPELYDPDAWNDEFAFLSRPGQSEIQSTLFYDYRTNVAAYPQWQAWLRAHHPPLLVVWGRYDPSFEVEGAWAYKRDIPSAEIHLLDAGHFALDEQAGEVIRLTRDFLRRHLRHH